MPASAQSGKYAAHAASAVVEETSERIDQLTRQIRDLQRQSQTLPSSLPEQDLMQLRQRIQSHYQEIFRLEKEKARSRNRNGSYLSVVLSVATCSA
jgi:septal ring factor EnvC (AmiA/AmiB activator)